MIPIIGLASNSGAGKTTLIRKLIKELSNRGYKVAAIKHSRHKVDLDREGKDTALMSEAGAVAVSLASQGKISMYMSVEEEWSPEDIVAKLFPAVDLVLVEGFGKADRQGKFLDAIMSAGGITNRNVAKAMLGTLDIETAPENFTDKDARDAAKLLRKEAPEIFGAGSSTDPKPPPGSGKTPPEKGTHEYYKAVGAAFTDRGANTPYAVGRKAATGQ